MPTIRMRQSIEDMLETSARTVHFRRVKIAIYAVNIVVGVFLAVFLAVYFGARIKPLFIPLDLILLAVVVTEYIVFLESTVFKFLELRHAETASTRLIIVRRVQSRGMLALSVSLCVLVMMLLPATGQLAEKSTASTWQTDMLPGQYSLNTTVGSKDSMGTTWVSSIELKVTYCQQLRYSLWTEGQDGVKKLVYAEIVTGDAPTLRQFNFTYSDGYMLYTIEFQNLVNSSAQVGYSTTTEFSNIYSLDMPLLGLVFICTSAPILGAAHIKKRKYFQDSIYESV